MPGLHMKGKELSRAFYSEILKPIIDIPHGAALIGEGSEALGYDTIRSTDHNWGPRVTLFVEDKNVAYLEKRIAEIIPSEYRGYQIKGYQKTNSEEKSVEVTTLRHWLQKNLRIADIDNMADYQWLGFPQQHLLQFVSGVVFQDDFGELARARDILSWYPQDVWLWMMAS